MCSTSHTLWGNVDLSNPWVRWSKAVKPKLTEEPVWYLKSIPYWEYLQTDHWKILKQKFIDKNGAACQQCGVRWIGQRDFIVTELAEEGCCEVESRPRPPKFNLHHLTYERLGEERLADVQLLCLMCHNLEHKPDTHAAKHWAEIIGPERVFPLVVAPW